MVRTTDAATRVRTVEDIEREAALADITHRFVEANGIRIHLAEAGVGPLVLLCHGWPESWYSWRWQLTALAEAGFRAVAPDMRGYGETDRPDAVESYTLLHLVGDVVGILDSLSVERAVVVGHDWGAPVAWQAALLRPDRFRGVAGLSVPLLRRGFGLTTRMMPRTERSIFYQLYFQTPGVAEAELERDPRATIRRLLYSSSGDAPRRGEDNPLPDRAPGMMPIDGGFLKRTIDPPALPTWLTEADIDYYAGEFARGGFRGGLNWYRNIDRNWELLAPFDGLPLSVPALFIGGDRDLVAAFRGVDRILASISKFAPFAEPPVILSGCGH